MPIEPLSTAKFSLDISGVAGFFGGDVAVQAMQTVHIYAGRRCMGWYNSPGNYDVAKIYGQIAKGRFWDGLFPGPNHEPAVLFDLDGKDGPAYRGVHSGTVLSKTSHTAHLVMQACKAARDPIRIEGRRPPSVPVSVVRLHKVPEAVERPALLPSHSFLLSLFPVLATAGTVVVCAVYRDWFCFATIVLGMLASGISCFIIGRGSLVYTHPIPAEGAPPGDGVLDNGSEVAVLLGAEGAVNAVTRGAFSLDFAPLLYHRHPRTAQHHDIGACALLLTVQFFAQLVLLTQGTLLGQIMFVASLVVSWAYNSYLCSIDRWQAQRAILMNGVLDGPATTELLLPTRTAAAIFVLLVLATQERRPVQRALCETLVALLPNKTHVWDAYRKAALRMVGERARGAAAVLTVPPASLAPMSADDRKLLGDLIRDANDACTAFERYRASMLVPAPDPSSSQVGEEQPKAKSSRLSRYFGWLFSTDQTGKLSDIELTLPTCAQPAAEPLYR